MSEINEIVHSIEDETDLSFTPNEQNRIKVERMSHDLNISISDLIDAKLSDQTRHHFNEDVKSDLWAAKTKLDLLLSELISSKKAG